MLKLSPPAVSFLCGFTISRMLGIAELASKYAGRERTLDQSMAYYDCNDHSAFDAMVKKATALVSDQHPAVRRQPFNVETFEYKGTGGLDDNNRVTLASIYGNASSVFEYGLGESTMIADHVGVKRYSGIDSDPVWVGKAREKVASHFRFYLADIGSTGGWGKPMEVLPKQVLNYQLAPLIVESKAFDVYMVDGRWRLACLLVSFLHASARGGESPTVLVHDCQRLAYHKADHLLDLEIIGDENKSTEKLCVYRRKPATTDGELFAIWESSFMEFGR